MIGINVGIPAPVAQLPFGGMRASLFADTKAQGKAVINFFTDQKIISERYWPEATECSRPDDVPNVSHGLGVQES